MIFCLTWGNMTDLGLYGRWASAQTIKEMWTWAYVCVQIHTQANTCSRPSTNLDSVKTSLLSHADKTPKWQRWRKWAKITRAIPEAFQSKDVPACLTLRQFSPVFRSDVVMLLSFPLYPVILNGQVEERITFLISFASLHLFVCNDVCGEVQSMSACLCWSTLHAICTNPNICYNMILKLIKTEKRKVTGTFIVIIRRLVCDMPPSPTIHMLVRALYTFCLYHDCLTLTNTRCGKMLMLTHNEGKKA